MFLLSWAKIVDILTLGHTDADGFEGFEILVMFFTLKLYLLAGEIFDGIVDHLELVECGLGYDCYSIAPEDDQRPEFWNIFSTWG